MADSLCGGVRKGHSTGPVTARQFQRKTTGILNKIADCAEPSSAVFFDALGPTPNGKLGRNRLSSVRGAEYLRRVRRGGSSFRERRRLVMSWRSLYRSLVCESRMDKLVAEVETMFSAIADAIYKRQLPKLES